MGRGYCPGRAYYSRDCRTYTLFGGECGVSWRGLLDLTKAIPFKTTRQLIREPCQHVPNACGRIAHSVEVDLLAWVRGVRFRSMIRRFLFAAIFFAAPVCQVSAQDDKVSVDMIGIGSMSCSHWRATKEHLLEGTVWIYGFWTGLNYVAAASGQSPANVNISAIVVEVEKTCAQQPSQTLASAVWTTYLGSKK